MKSQIVSCGMSLRHERTTMILPVITIITLCFTAGVYGKEGFRSGDQDWGYVTVRPHAHMFWWLYYTTANVTDYTDKPLVIWLQGGPGSSSTGFGNFEELGPLDLELNERNHTWIKDYNVLFIDNPIGAGFSYADDFEAYPHTNAAIAADLLACVKGFLIEHSPFATVPTYVIAESYGGKMAAEFAYVWYQAQTAGAVTSNLKGVALGDAWISPIDSVNSYAPYLLATGIVDTNGYEEIQAAAKLTQQAADEGDWLAATFGWSQTQLMIRRMTHNIDVYNILHEVEPGTVPKTRAEGYSKYVGHESRDHKLAALMNGPVKQALGLNITWGVQRIMIRNALAHDFMKPVTDQVEYLLNNTDIKVFVYTGQLDLIVDTPGTIRWVERLKWPNATEWLSSSRDTLVVDSIIEGYVKNYGKLKFYWISRAGHIVPVDNPAATAAMLEDLTSNAGDN